MCSDVIVCPGKSHSTSVCPAFGKMGHSAWGEGCRPPQGQCGTGHRCAHPTSRPEGWSSVWRTREGGRGLLWMGVGAEVTDSHPRGRGPREPRRLSGSSHPQFPSPESSWNQKARSGSGSARQLPHPRPGTQSRMERGSPEEVEVSRPGFISCGHHNTLHKLGGLKQEKLTLSHFWRPEVQDQGCPRSLPSLWRGNPCLASSSSWCCWLLGLWPYHSFPFSVFT